MKEIILIKDGELALKGLNRSSFEDMLCKNIRQRIKPFGAFEIKKSQSTITVAPSDEYADIDSATDEISRVFGILCFGNQRRQKLYLPCIMKLTKTLNKQTFVFICNYDLIRIMLCVNLGSKVLTVN